MYCQNCGAEIPDNTKFCGECGAKVIGAYDIPESGRPGKKKKRWVIPVVVIFAVILGLVIALLVLRGQSVVYKYDSVSVDAGDGIGGYLGGGLVETIADSMLKDMYVEIGFDKTITLFSQDLGYYTASLDELGSEAGAEDVEYTVDREFISLGTEGVTVMFRRVSDKDELNRYKQLLEAAVANGEEMEFPATLFE